MPERLRHRRAVPIALEVPVVLEVKVVAHQKAVPEVQKAQRKARFCME